MSNILEQERIILFKPLQQLLPIHLLFIEVLEWIALSFQAFDDRGMRERFEWGVWGNLVPTDRCGYRW